MSPVAVRGGGGGKKERKRRKPFHPRKWNKKGEKRKNKDVRRNPYKGVSSEFISPYRRGRGKKKEEETNIVAAPRSIEEGEEEGGGGRKTGALGALARCRRDPVRGARESRGIGGGGRKEHLSSQPKKRGGGGGGGQQGEKSGK